MLCLWRLKDYFFINAQKHGGSKNNFIIAKMLFCSWRVRSEEKEDPNNSPLEHVANKMTSTCL